MSVGNHVWRDDAPKARLAPDLYSLEALRRWFAEFVAHAKMYAAWK
jgi:hypothetical protein